MISNIPNSLRVLAAVLIGLTFQPVNAQEWPNKPIRIIVPLPAGGVVDVGAAAVGVVWW